MDYHTSSRCSELFRKSAGCPSWSITGAGEWVCHGLQLYREVRSSCLPDSTVTSPASTPEIKSQGKKLDLELTKHLFSFKNINNILTLYDKVKPLKGFTEPRQSQHMMLWIFVNMRFLIVTWHFFFKIQDYCTSWNTLIIACIVHQYFTQAVGNFSTILLWYG